MRTKEFIGTTIGGLLYFASSTLVLGAFHALNIDALTFESAEARVGEGALGVLIGAIGSMVIKHTAK